MSINMKFEVLLLFFCMIIISGCSTDNFNESCSSDIGNFGHDVVLTKYYAFDSYFFDGIYKKNTTLTFSAMRDFKLASFFCISARRNKASASFMVISLVVNLVGQFKR